ncbi:unnamed protein product, partial [Adineta steineri]
MCAFHNGSHSDMRASNSIHRKLALVFGNRLYEQNDILINSENDANDMTRSLESIGFRVLQGLNLPCKDMNVYVTEFVRNIRSSDMVLFYFSGHGTQWEDQNYLVPSDDKNLDSKNIKDHAINAQYVHDQITKYNPYVSIFILDCCRNYYLHNEGLLRGSDSNRKGLKEMSTAAGSLIAFACEPGATASDGSERNNVNNGVVTESYNKQTPWYHSSLTDRNIILSGIGNDNRSRYNKWKQNAITVAGENEKGRKLNQLYSPFGIFLDKKKNIFIADYDNHRIIKWKYNAEEGQVVAGGYRERNQMDQLNSPTDVIVDQQNHSIIIADHRNRRVIQWLNQNQQVLINNIDCFGLAIDKHGFFYVSDWKKNEVRRWKIGENNEGIVVVGGHGKGNQLNQLDFPTFIFVDQDQSVYVSDENNHRVMKWKKDAKGGRVVAGGNGRGGNLNQLSSPRGVMVDHLSQVYVADSENHRVMRWCEGKEEGDIIVGGNGGGNQSNQLSHPRGISFDDEGNLYVADCCNNRIEKFE